MSKQKEINRYYTTNDINSQKADAAASALLGLIMAKCHDCNCF